MKVKSEDAIYNIPIISGTCILAGSHTDDLLENLSNYFVKGKKNRCVVLDEEGDLISPKDVAFIYISKDEDLNQIYDFKPRTLLNDETTEFLNENQEKFQSIETIRKASRDLLTDIGFYKLREIMKKNTEISVDIEMTDFNISRLIQMYSIDTDKITVEEQFILLYNILLYAERNKFKIIYIDYSINDKTIDWICKTKSQDTLFLMKNESIESQNLNYIDYMLLLSSNDFIEYRNHNKREIKTLSYCFNRFTLRNIEFQTEKNKRIIGDFLDEKSTFLVKFTPDNDLEIA